MRVNQRQHQVLRKGFAHPSFVDMLALSFIAVMILFMLFVSRNKWQQQVFSDHFLTIDARVQDENGKLAGSPISLALVGPNGDGAARYFPMSAGNEEPKMGSSSAYSRKKLPRYRVSGFSKRDKAVTRLELSEGRIHETGQWHLIAYFHRAQIPQEGGLRWHISITSSDPGAGFSGVMEFPLLKPVLSNKDRYLALTKNITRPLGQAAVRGILQREDLSEFTSKIADSDAERVLIHQFNL